MTDLPIRRIIWVLLAYALGAWLVLQFGGAIRRLLLLPPLFETLLNGALVLGVPLAIAVAWRYPQLGEQPAPDPDSERAEPRP